MAFHLGLKKYKKENDDLYAVKKESFNFSENNVKKNEKDGGINFDVEKVGRDEVNEKNIDNTTSYTEAYDNIDQYLESLNTKIEMLSNVNIFSLDNFASEIIQGMDVDEGIVGSSETEENGEGSTRSELAEEEEEDDDDFKSAEGTDEDDEEQSLQTVQVPTNTPNDTPQPSPKSKSRDNKYKDIKNRFKFTKTRLMYLKNVAQKVLKSIREIHKKYDVSDEDVETLAYIKNSLEHFINNANTALKIKKKIVMDVMDEDDYNFVLKLLDEYDYQKNPALFKKLLMQQFGMQEKEKEEETSSRSSDWETLPSEAGSGKRKKKDKVLKGGKRRYFLVDEKLNKGLEGVKNVYFRDLYNIAGRNGGRVYERIVAFLNVCKSETDDEYIRKNKELLGILDLIYLNIMNANDILINMINPDQMSNDARDLYDMFVIVGKDVNNIMSSVVDERTARKQQREIDKRIREWAKIAETGSRSSSGIASAITTSSDNEPLFLSNNRLFNLLEKSEEKADTVKQTIYKLSTMTHEYFLQNKEIRTLLARILSIIGAFYEVIVKESYMDDFAKMRNKHIKISVDELNKYVDNNVVKTPFVNSHKDLYYLTEKTIKKINEQDLKFINRSIAENKPVKYTVPLPVAGVAEMTGSGKRNITNNIKHNLKNANSQKGKEHDKPLLFFPVSNINKVIGKGKKKQKSLTITHAPDANNYHEFIKDI
jgi:hypothetical protein